MLAWTGEPWTFRSPLVGMGMGSTTMHIGVEVENRVSQPWWQHMPVTSAQWAKAGRSRLHGELQGRLAIGGDFILNTQSNPWPQQQKNHHDAVTQFLSTNLKESKWETREPFAQPCPCFYYGQWSNYPWSSVFEKKSTEWEERGKRDSDLMYWSC